MLAKQMTTQGNNTNSLEHKLSQNVHKTNNLRHTTLVFTTISARLLYLPAYLRLYQIDVKRHHLMLTWVLHTGKIFVLCESRK